MISTNELVYQAADELLSEGIKPSQQLVREKIGKGSATTIHRALNEWWGDLGKRLTQQEEKNDGIPIQVQRALNDLWSTMRKQAELQLQQQQTSYLEKAKHDRKLITEEKQAFANKVEKLSEQLDKSYSRIDRLQNELNALQEQNIALEKQLYKKTVDLEKSQQENKVLDKIVKNLDS